MKWLKLHLWCRIFHRGYISPHYGTWVRNHDCEVCEDIRYCWECQKAHWKVSAK